MKFLLSAIIFFIPIASVAAGNGVFSANNVFFGYSNDYFWFINKNGTASPTNYPGSGIVSIVYRKGHYLLADAENHLYQSANGIQWTIEQLTYTESSTIDSVSIVTLVTVSNDDSDF